MVGLKASGATAFGAFFLQNDHRSRQNQCSKHKADINLQWRMSIQAQSGVAYKSTKNDQRHYQRNSIYLIAQHQAD